MVRQGNGYRESVQKQNRRRYQEIDGTSARVLHSVPDYMEPDYNEPDYDEYEDDFLEERRRHRTYQERKRAQRAASRRKEKTRTMDGISLILLIAAVAVTFYMCVSYIRVQADLTMLNRQVAKNESLLIQMTKDNNAEAEEIARVYDLDYVYRIATKELGMVFPTKDQIVSYESKRSEYVKQFEKIPSSDKTK